MCKIIYIMPAGTIGAVVYYALMNGIALPDNSKDFKIAGFLDSAKGQRLNPEFCNIPIYVPDKADRNATVIVGSFRFGKKIIQRLQELGFTSIISADSFLTLENTTALLEQIRNDRIEERYNLISIENSLKSFFIDYNAVADALTLKNVNFVVTQRCTLMCRNCSALMPYYEKPKDHNMVKILESVDRLFAFVDNVRSVNIIGGEPLVVKDLAPLINKLHNYRSKIGELTMVTNGTVVPSDEVLTAMHHANLVVRISDYGKLSNKLNELQKSLQSCNIRCDTKKDLIWTIDYSMCEKSDFGEEIFSNCDAYCSQVLDGKLYYCPFAAHGDELRAFPSDKNNYIDLFSSNTTKDTVRAYMERSCALPACQYCTGSKVAGDSIPVARQARKRLTYKRYL